MFKFSSFPKIDQALKIWFYQQRELNRPVTLDYLRTMSKEFYEGFFPDPTNRPTFLGSVGYVQKFLARNSIKLRNMHGENESCDLAAAEAYKIEFPRIIAGYSVDQIYNADETGLIYFSLPTKTYTTPDENKIKGWKKSKDRVTLMLCSNASEKHKLPMVFIHKYENPHCSKELQKRIY